MANLHASKKDIRKTAKRNLRNRMIRSELKTLARRLTEADRSGSGEVRSLAMAYSSALDKAAKRGVIHVNRCSRQKSALSRLIFSAQPSSSGVAC